MNPQAEPASAPDATWFWQLFLRLRRTEGFADLAPGDVHLLLHAVGKGFGVRDRASFHALCCSLYAKTPAQRDLLLSVLAELPPLSVHTVVATPSPEETDPLPPFQPDDSALPPTNIPSPPLPEWETSGETTPAPTPEETKSVEQVQLEQKPREPRRRSPLPPAPQLADESLRQVGILTLNYGLDALAITQSARRLRRPVRDGVRTEPDIHATIARRCRTGLPTPLVLRPRLRSPSRVILLLDRQGNMAPFHGICDYAASAIAAGGPPGWASTFYFRELPARGEEAAVTIRISDAVQNRAAKMASVAPMREGRVYVRPTLTGSIPFATLLAHMHGAFVVVLSDFGAMSRECDPGHILDSAAFVNALSNHAARVVALNPLPRERWSRTTAEAVADLMPEFPLSRSGIKDAMELLRSGIGGK